MRHLRYFLLAPLGWGATGAMAADVKVIANSSVGAWLATKSSPSDGSDVQPVLLKSGAVHAAFLKDYFGQSESAAETDCRSLVFTRKSSMPKAFATGAEVVAYVEQTEGSIRHVAAATSTANAKVLEVE